MTADLGTYLELQNRVATRVIDLPSQVQAEVPILINEALRVLMSKHSFKCMEAEMYAWTQYGNRTLQTGAPSNAQPYWNASFPNSTTIGNLSINPYTFKGFSDGDEPVFIRYSDGSIRFLTVAPSRRSIYGGYSEGDYSFPALILDAPASDNYNDRVLQVYPLPDGSSDWPDGEYRIWIPYYQYLPNLVAGTDYNWLTLQPAGENYIINMATAKAFALDWDTQHSMEWQQRAEMEFRDIVGQDKKYRLSSVNEMAVHHRGVYQQRTRA